MSEVILTGSVPNFKPTLAIDQESLLARLWESNLHRGYLQSHSLYETIGVFTAGETSDEFRSTTSEQSDYTLLLLVLHGEARAGVRRLHDIPGRPRRTWDLRAGDWIAIPPQHAVRFRVLRSERVLIGKLTVRTYKRTESAMVG